MKPHLLGREAPLKSLSLTRSTVTIVGVNYNQSYLSRLLWRPKLYANVSLLELCPFHGAYNHIVSGISVDP